MYIAGTSYAIRWRICLYKHHRHVDCPYSNTICVSRHLSVFTGLHVTSLCLTDMHGKADIAVPRSLSCDRQSCLVRRSEGPEMRKMFSREWAHHVSSNLDVFEGYVIKLDIFIGSHCLTHYWLKVRHRMPAIFIEQQPLTDSMIFINV